MICNWSIVIRLLCVGRCSLAPGDGEHSVLAVYVDAPPPPRRPAYRNNLHAGNSSETNCNPSYYLRRTRYNFERPGRRGQRTGGTTDGDGRGRTGEYFMVINERPRIPARFLPAHLSSSRIREMRIGSTRRNGNPFLTLDKRRRFEGSARKGLARNPPASRASA